VNRENGYIDGSVYIEQAHHPVDMSAIEFGEPTDAGIPARIVAKFELSFGGLMDYEGFECELNVLFSIFRSGRPA
jgi:hypothetical protein